MVLDKGVICLLPYLKIQTKIMNSNTGEVAQKKHNSAGNNSQSSDIVRPNFENVQPISHYDRTR